MPSLPPAKLREPLGRVERLGPTPDLEVQAWSGERPAVPDRSDLRPALHRVPDAAPELAEVARSRVVPAAVVEDHEPAVAAEPAGVAHAAHRDGVHRKACRRLE